MVPHDDIAQRAPELWCLPCSLLFDRLQAHEIMSITAYFSTPLHWNDENHPE